MQRAKVSNASIWCTVQSFFLHLMIERNTVALLCGYVAISSRVQPLDWIRTDTRRYSPQHPLLWEHSLFKLTGRKMQQRSSLYLAQIQKQCAHGDFFPPDFHTKMNWFICFLLMYIMNTEIRHRGHIFYFFALFWSPPTVDWNLCLLPVFSVGKHWAGTRLMMVIRN